MSQLPSSAHTKKQGRELCGRKVRRGENGEPSNLGKKGGGSHSRLAAAVTSEVLDAKIHPVVVAGVGQTTRGQGLSQGHADQSQATTAPLILKAFGTRRAQAQMGRAGTQSASPSKS
jgi:hypothetical protein